MWIAVKLLGIIALLAIAWRLHQWHPPPSPQWRQAFRVAASALLSVTVILVGFGRFAFDMSWPQALKASGAAILIPAAAVVVVAWARRTTWPTPRDAVEPFAVTLVALGTAASQSPDMFVKDFWADCFFGVATGAYTIAVVVAAARLPAT
jgi:peptidoglycan/LPS O-acetylase OafA/YrhL